MARRRTLLQNIRHYKQQYLRLLAYEARLNHQLFNMKKRIKLRAQEEQLRLTEKALLSEHLQQVHQYKSELESQEPSKQRDTQLKRVEKEYKQVKARHSRNQYQLDQLEVKKEKDNVVKLLAKEAKREDVTVRIQSAYETWMYFEQMAQYEAMHMEQFQAMHQSVSNTLVDHSSAEQGGKASLLNETQKIYSLQDTRKTRPRLAGLQGRRDYRFLGLCTMAESFPQTFMVKGH